MKKFVVVGVLALALAGCFEPTPEQIQNVNENLPEGCTLHDLGRYGQIDNLVVVPLRQPAYDDHLFARRGIDRQVYND